jgi:ligand-binding sensor domain-containing protein
MITAQDNEQIRFNRIATENPVIEKGLSQNTVRTILQDSKGFLWFGTWDGLNKFDSYEFKIYNRENGLSNTEIHCLFEDDNGMLWIGTENGLNMLNRETREIIQYFHNPDSSNSISNNKIHSICEDENGCLWIGTGRGLSKYDPIAKKFTSFLHTPEDNSSLRSNRITKVFIDKNGELWIGTYYGLIKLNINSLLMTRFYHRPKDSMSLSDNLVREIFEDSDGVLWIGTENGLNRFDEKNHTFISYLNKPDDFNNRIYSIFEDDDGILWIGTHGGGIILFNKKNEKFLKRYYYSSDDINSLSNNNVYSIYEDNTGNIWIGTYSGVNKVEPSVSKFNKFTRVPHEKNSLSSDIVWAFLEKSEDTMWIATNNGINIFNKRNGSFSFIQKDINQRNTLSSNKTKALFKDSHGIIWIGTEDKGIDKLNTRSGEFTNYKHNDMNPNSLADNDVWFIGEDKQNLLWIGTGNGLSRFDRENNVFTNYKNNPFDSTSICGNMVYCMFEDDKGSLFFCTKNGLCSFDAKKNNFHRYTFFKEGKKIINIRVVSVHKDSDGIFWLGTMGEGLLKFDPEKNESEFITVENGLPNNVVYVAIEDSEENLWLSTNWGLSKYNKKTGAIVNYDIEDGLQSYEFNAGAYYKCNDGEIYFGGMNGFNSFYPDQIKALTFNPNLVITDFKIFNKETNREYFDGDTIILDYTDNFFSFEFSSLDFINPFKNKYKYYLENVDKEWIETDATHRFAEYKNISPGSYTFRLKASNHDNSWDNKGIAVTIIIVPPWWNTSIFKILFSLAFVFTIAFLVNRRFKNLKKKHQKEKKVLEIQQQLTELERKSLRLQMNPHFIFNSLNSIQSFVISNDPDKAIHYLAKFSKLMRMILQNSRETHIALSEEIKSLNYYMDMEKLRFDDKFDYTIDVDKSVDTEFIGIPPMIIQPYVENSIIHGLINKSDKGKISICFVLIDNYIKCVIKDNGIGRDKAMEIKKSSGLKRESQGMQITKERLDILSKDQNEQFDVQITDLKNDDGTAAGTKVELKIFYVEL